MIKFLNTIHNSFLSAIFALTLGVGLLMGLSGCGSSSSGPVVVDEDANGLFTGTGDVNSGTLLTAVRGFVYGGRFIFFDEAEAVLYDGQITDISGSDLTATLDVYKDGAVNTSSVNVTGTVTGESSLSIALNGTGYGAGNLTLTFDPQYNKSASFAKLETPSGSIRWIGDSHTPTTTVSGNIRFLSFADNTFRGDTGSPSQCNYEPGIKSIPDADKNIYQITTLDVEDIGGMTCDHVGVGYTGFFAVVDGVGTDDTVLFAASNGAFANFSVMPRTSL